MSADLPLFEAPYNQAALYAGAGRCSLCGKHRADTLALTDEDEDEDEDGVEVLVDCHSCRSRTAIYHLGLAEASCVQCGVDFELPRLAEPARACFTCVAAGHVCFVHHSEVGRVSWDGRKEEDFFADAAAASDPATLLDGSGFHPGRNDGQSTETGQRRRFAISAAEDAWTQDVTVSLQERRLLAITPPVAYWGDDPGWLVCCASFMAYIGHWTQRDFDENTAGESVQTLFERTVADGFGLEMKSFAPDLELAKIFRCRKCAARRGILDLPP